MFSGGQINTESPSPIERRKGLANPLSCENDIIVARLWKRRGELFRIYSDVEVCLPQLSQLAGGSIIQRRRSTFLRSQPPQLTSNLGLKRRASQAGSWSNAASGVGAHELWHDRRALIRANQWQQQTNDHQFVPNLRRPSTGPRTFSQLAQPLERAFE